MPHASGRPWLVGCWDGGELVLAGSGRVRLAVLGLCSLGGDELARRSVAVSRPQEVEAVLDGAAGSFAVLASVDGETYARGSAFGARRLYHARMGGVTVVADRARTLAHLTGATADPAVLAALLAGPGVPYPLGEAVAWQGVESIGPGRALLVDADGVGRSRVWWRAPEPVLPLKQGATALRHALCEAVAVRVRTGQVWGADVSGGTDSTSVAFLAAEAGARLVAATLHWANPNNQDHRYARQAVDALGVPHLTFPSDRVPGHFDGLHLRLEPGDGPSLGIRDRLQQEHMTELLREHGAVARFSGHGGDHAVIPPPGYVHGLARRRPLLALRHTTGYRARSRWPLASAARLLTDMGSYPSWLNAQARLLGSPRTALGRPPVGWGPPVTLPVWAGDHARDLVAGLLRDAAENGDGPLAAGRGHHARVEQAIQAGRGACGITAAHGPDHGGLPIHMPFCDDAVLEACLAVRPEDAASPWVYKPLLAEAMRGLVPDAILERTTKDHCGDEWHSGLVANRHTLAAFATDSHLAAIGLADPGALRRALISPALLTGGAAELEHTLAAEAWLRDIAAHPEPAYLKVHRHEPDPVP
ncbi:asparagine synthase-related protein [Streptosporangium sp. NPDC000239]|uniref:asparagine synthase-related protein n=1 Tax=Streptosporangium sp. NPDC000239 TaxID=3154248 RepID=UPI00331A0E0B